MDLSKLEGLAHPQGAAAKLAEKMREIENPLHNISPPPSQLPLFDAIPKVDRRSRQEVREDYEQQLADIEESDIREAIEFIENQYEMEYDHDEHSEKKELVTNCLEKLLRYKAVFEQLNGNHIRHINLKREELKLDADADWREKWRTFWFRVLGSALLIVTLFAIGTINQAVSWLYLPFESIIKPDKSIDSIATQALLNGNTTQLVPTEEETTQVPDKTTNNKE